MQVTMSGCAKTLKSTKIKEVQGKNQRQRKKGKKSVPEELTNGVTHYEDDEEAGTWSGLTQKEIHSEWNHISEEIECEVLSKYGIASSQWHKHMGRGIVLD